MNKANRFGKLLTRTPGFEHWHFYPGMSDKFTIKRYRPRRLNNCLTYPAYQRFVEARRKQSTKDLFRLLPSGFAYPRFLMVSDANFIVVL